MLWSHIAQFEKSLKHLSFPGNFVCEPGESDCSDCGPFKVVTPECSSCVVPYGEMFDVEALEDLSLTGITFKIRTGSNTITLFTAPSGYSTISRDPGAWTQIFSGTFEVSSGSKWDTVRFVLCLHFVETHLRANYSFSIYNCLR